MNNVHHISQEEVLPLHDAMTQLIASYEADAESYDLLADNFAKLEEANAILRLERNNANGRLDEVLKENESLVAELREIESKEEHFNKQAEMVTQNAKKHMDLLAQKDRELTQTKNALKDIKASNSSYKALGTVKNIKEKFKNYQATIAKDKAAITELKKSQQGQRKEVSTLQGEIKSLHVKLAQVSMTSVYSNEGEYLLLFPAMLKMKVNHYQESQVVMLYLHEEGRGGLIAIDEHGEPQFPSAPKRGLKPKKSTMNHCGQFLRRVKSQNWTLTPEDLVSIEG